jgi:hypothetical protein
VSSPACCFMVLDVLQRTSGMAFRLSSLGVQLCTKSLLGCKLTACQAASDSTVERLRYSCCSRRGTAEGCLFGGTILSSIATACNVWPPLYVAVADVSPAAGAGGGVHCEWSVCGSTGVCANESWPAQQRCMLTCWGAGKFHSSLLQVLAGSQSF